MAVRELARKAAARHVPLYLRLAPASRGETPALGAEPTHCAASTLCIRFFRVRALEALAPAPLRAWPLACMCAWLITRILCGEQDLGLAVLESEENAVRVENWTPDGEAMAEA